MTTLIMTDELEPVLKLARKVLKPNNAWLPSTSIKLTSGDPHHTMIQAAGPNAQVEIWVGHGVNEDGEFNHTVEIAPLMEFLAKQKKDSEILIKQRVGKLEFVGPNGKTLLPTSDPDTYPVNVPKGETNVGWVDAWTFYTALAQTISSADTKGQRLAFRAVRMNGQRLAATNGFRGTIVDIPEEGGHFELERYAMAESLQVLMPLLLLEEQDATVQISEWEGWLIFQGDGWRFSTLQMKEPFPDIEAFLDLDMTGTIYAMAGDLRDAARLANGTANEGRLSFEVAERDDEMFIIGRSERGTTTGMMPVDHTLSEHYERKGMPGEIYFQMAAGQLLKLADDARASTGAVAITYEHGRQQVMFRYDTEEGVKVASTIMPLI